MKWVWEFFAWAIIASLLAILVRLILVETNCDEIVKKHIGDSIPRSIDVNPAGDFLTGECSYKMISNNIKVS
jgi:hypothetical protein